MNINDQDFVNLHNILGSSDSNMQIICQLLNVKFSLSQNNRTINFEGTESNKKSAYNVLNKLIGIAKSKREIDTSLVAQLIVLEKRGRLDEFESLESQVICKTYNNVRINPKTPGQRDFIETIDKNNIIFASGPAGTGKTFLAAAYSVSQLKSNNIKKIYLARPAVEAREKLGFLPGDLKEKVEMYLVPLLNSFNELLGKEVVERYTSDKDTRIEIGAIAYMRGLTFNDTIVIIDEAQNLSMEQFKLILTRIGKNTKIIVCGDTRQSDLDNGRTNKTSLEKLISYLEKEKDKGRFSNFGVCNLTNDDVVRSLDCLNAIILMEEMEEYLGIANIMYERNESPVNRLCSLLETYIVSNQKEGNIKK